MDGNYAGHFPCILEVTDVVHLVEQSGDFHDAHVCQFPQYSVRAGTIFIVGFVFNYRFRIVYTH